MNNWLNTIRDQHLRTCKRLDIEPLNGLMLAGNPKTIRAAIRYHLRKGDRIQFLIGEKGGSLEPFISYAIGIKVHVSNSIRLAS